MTKNIKNSYWNLSDDDGYRAWRQHKLQQTEKLQNAGFIRIKDLSNPSASEKSELFSRCKKTNMALYQIDEFDDPEKTKIALREFAKNLGLVIAEKHRSAGKEGIVAITISNAPTQRAYIPYSNRALNWHSDGYYNAENEQIRSMVLHCFKPAQRGGESQFFDPEIAYIRLRDENPNYIKALMHKEAMIIPQNLDEKGGVRPISVGPVFSFDKDNNLIMRYTARTRSIEWRKDKDTQEAVRFLQDLLINGDEFIQRLTLKAGQGILCNNSLHNRSAFEKQENNERLLFRVRFHNRIKDY